MVNTGTDRMVTLMIYKQNIADGQPRSSHLKFVKFSKKNNIIHHRLIKNEFYKII